MKIVAQSPRLILRHFTPKDLDALVPIAADPEVMRFSLRGVQTRSQTQEFLDWIISSYSKYGFGLYALIYQPNQELIGYCGLLFWSLAEIQEVEIGYRLARAYWGHGLGTEAAIAVRNYAQKQLQLKRLICLIEPENIRSIRVAEKLDMKHEKNIIFKGLQVRIYSWQDLT